MFIDKVGLFASSPNLQGDRTGSFVRVWEAGTDTVFLSDKRIRHWDGEDSPAIEVSLQLMMTYSNSAVMEEDVRSGPNEEDADYDGGEDNTDFVYYLRRSDIVGVDDSGNFLTDYSGLRANEIMRRALMRPDRSFTIISSHGFVYASSAARVLIIKTTPTEQPVRGDISVGHKFYTPVSFETKDISFGETIKVVEGDILLAFGIVTLTISAPFAPWSGRVVGGSAPTGLVDLQRVEAVGHLMTIAATHKKNEASFLGAVAKGSNTITPERLDEVRRASEESGESSSILSDFLYLPYGRGDYMSMSMSTTMHEVLEAAFTRACNRPGGSTRRQILLDFLRRIDEALQQSAPAAEDTSPAPATGIRRAGRP